jgi:hypothetical protein
MHIGSQFVYYKSMTCLQRFGTYIFNIRIKNAIFNSNNERYKVLVYLLDEIPVALAPDSLLNVVFHSHF